MSEEAGAHGKSCHAAAAKPTATTALTLETVRERLRDARGPEFWRSLDELAGSPQFEEMVHREFPRQASEWIDTADGVNRRRFLQLSSASLALAGLTACTRQPLEKIVPYAKQPEDLLPGVPQFYATAMALSGYGLGLLAESHMGRPTKVEGNPEHPASLGATDTYAQASVLGLYDPDRSQVISYLGKTRTWDAFVRELETALNAQRGVEGAGLRLLTETITSPTLAAQIQALLSAFPRAKWQQWDAAGRDPVRAGSQLAFGAYVETRYDLAKADVIVTLDSDFLTSGPGAVRYARDFANRRRVLAGSNSMNRLYALETTPTPTGTMSDHRYALKPSEIAAAALELAAELGVPGAIAVPSARTMIPAIARDLQAHRGASLVIAGEQCPAAVHALAHAINAALGNFGTTVLTSDPVEAMPVDQAASIAELTRDLNAGAVDLLVILGGNPVYDAPADLEFAAAIRKAPLRVHLGLYFDETAELCQWHVPETHYLESWGDVRAYDGTVTIQQPLIESLYGGKSAPELLAALLGDGSALGLDVVKAGFASWSGDGSEGGWRRALHDGLVAGTVLPAKTWAVDGATAGKAAAAIAAKPAASGGIELVLRPDPGVYDGRFANNPWLQELPRPLTKLTWDNALMLSPGTARALGVEQEQVVEVRVGERSVRAPVWIEFGHADGAATLHLGYGRWKSGRVANGLGTNTTLLRTVLQPWGQAGVAVTATGERYELASTQMHSNIPLETTEAGKRHLLRVADLATYTAHPDTIHEMAPHVPDITLYPPDHTPTGYAWGMAIDLNACTGCNACVLACQSENNIPVVGKEQVRKGREMHWIRIDRYYRGDLDNPEAYSQPIVCMQCENAPCETVCPVAATTHSAEGLNDMVYNRCVGTRYCSNNCPYKVRHFNFFNWNVSDWNNARTHPVLELRHNPEVTVRVRGVMEKCTYCVQRINRAKIAAQLEDRKVRDGEIQTACQQACPTQAIVFGDIRDADQQVSRWKTEPRNYTLLDELNTKPRTSYLARLKNLNPELIPAPAATAVHHS
jgi:MoCo/4Fe-4S cofactor protein with predicted Tat translocation signal